ncbi:MAG: hypothetical protein KAH23_01315 [Kiritimatiellae bacterium]|nr:hypothetical protein [Kiritimatiellia bacterium]
MQKGAVCDLTTNLAFAVLKLSLQYSLPMANSIILATAQLYDDKACKELFDGRKVWIQQNKGGIDMGDQGKKDKGRREQQKKAKLTPKEKRQQKKEKKRG